MITEDFLLAQGFTPPIEFDTTWSLKLDIYSAEPVFNCDSIYIEVCTKMQNIRIHYVNENESWDVDDCIWIFLNNINTNKKILKFLTLINK